jgi:hypothetical protein
MKTLLKLNISFLVLLRRIRGKCLITENLGLLSVHKIISEYAEQIYGG